MKPKKLLQNLYFFIVENGNTIHLLTFSFSQNIQNPDSLVKSKVCKKERN